MQAVVMAVVTSLAQQWPANGVVLLRESRRASLCLAYACWRQGGPVMTMERHVRLFRNGRNQALRIPAEFELPGKEAIVRKEGDRLIVEPTKRQTLLSLLAGWEPLEEEFPEIEDAAPEPVDL